MKYILDINSEYYEYCKKGIGTFVYKYSLDNYKAQATSQLVAILYNAGIIEWNKSKRPIKFWIEGEYSDKLDKLFTNHINNK